MRALCYNAIMKMSMEPSMEMRQTPERQEVKTLQDIYKEAGIILQEGLIEIDQSGRVALSPELEKSRWQTGLVFNKDDSFDVIKKAYETRKKEGYDQKVGFVSSEGFEDTRCLLYRESLAQRAAPVFSDHHVDIHFSPKFQLSDGLLENYQDLRDSGLSEKEALRRLFEENDVLYLDVADGVGIYFQKDDMGFKNGTKDLEDAYNLLRNDRTFIQSGETIINQGNK